MTNYNNELDFISIIKKIYKSKKEIIYITIFFLIIGVILSYLAPIKYSSSTIFIPQNQDSSNSSLSGVASLVGINFGPNLNGSEIPSSMYPQVIESTKFKRLLLKSIIDKKKNQTLKSYIIEYYKIDNSDHANDSPIYVSQLEEDCFEKISDLISVYVNQKDGFVTITGIMSIAEYSAIIAINSKDILQKIIIENKIESARQNLKFSEEQLNEKKLEFDKIQARLSYFKDSNLNSVNSFVINEKDKLEAEFQIISSVVTELAQQVEQAKLQVSMDTPVFSTIREAVIPNKRTSPKRGLSVIIYFFVGLITSILYILIKDPIKKIYLELKD
tara:strand:- start:2155 stop:3144 length:990 start_codon:yes stop_codon:yes gene_type:complete